MSPRNPFSRSHLFDMYMLPYIRGNVRCHHVGTVIGVTMCPFQCFTNAVLLILYWHLLFGNVNTEKKRLFENAFF